MSNEVKRYVQRRSGIDGMMPVNQSYEGIDKQYVLASDYAALEAECSRLRAALGQYADDNNWCYDTCNISRDVAKDALAAGGGCV